MLCCVVMCTLPGVCVCLIGVNWRTDSAADWLLLTHLGIKLLTPSAAVEANDSKQVWCCQRWISGRGLIGCCCICLKTEVAWNRYCCSCLHYLIYLLFLSCAPAMAKMKKPGWSWRENLHFGWIPRASVHKMNGAAQKSENKKQWSKLFSVVYDVDVCEFDLKPQCEEFKLLNVQRNGFWNT